MLESSLEENRWRGKEITYTSWFRCPRDAGHIGRIHSFSMLQLYCGSGSREVQLVSEHNSTVWALLKRNVVRYLQQKGEKAAAQILADTPFELWHGTNGFGERPAHRSKVFAMFSHSASSDSRQTGLPARPYQYPALL
jgi:hypothetical protein